MGREVVFAISAGGGEIGRQASYCVRSIRYHHPEAPIYAGVPRSESPPEILSQTDAKIVSVDMPIKDYPISAKVATLSEVESRDVADSVVLLDSDTLLANPLSIPDNGSELQVKPSDCEPHFWRRLERVEWKKLYEQNGYSPPLHRVKGTVDGREMYPFYNAGVVISHLSSFGSEWLKLLSQIYDQYPESIYSDQVAFTVAASEYCTNELTEKYNYPLYLRLKELPNTQIIHYREPYHLIKSRYSKEIMNTIGMEEYMHSSLGSPGNLYHLVKSTLNGLIKKIK